MTSTDYISREMNTPSGIIIPVPTAMQDGRADRESIAKIVTSNPHAAGYMAHSSTGEKWRLGNADLDEAMRGIVEGMSELKTRGGSDKPLWVILTTQNFMDDRKLGYLADKYTRMGATAGVVVPLKHRSNGGLLQRGNYSKRGILEGSFGDINDSPLDIILYDNPAITRGESLDADTLKMMLDADKNNRIVGIKVSNNYDQMKRLSKASEGKIRIYAGGENFASPHLENGQLVQGAVSGFAPVAFDVVNNYVRHIMEADRAGIDPMHRAFIHSAYEMMGPNREKAIPVIKYLLKEQGIIASDEVASGTPELTKEEKLTLTRLLDNLKQYNSLIARTDKALKNDLVASAGLATRIRKL
ncbi:dihydrodipicolinate synthase family protein [Candidatus Woesearchaeota archaeon]|nr:dihydrodipicolinate synthase family protein [Candidatus Woesearchaeota archaeon]